MRTNVFFLVALASLLTPIGVWAQDSVVQPARKPAVKKLTKSADDLQKSLKRNDEGSIARNYEQIAQTLINSGQQSKAEEYLKKALEIYARNKNSEDIARVTRNLAKVQESQNKLGSAAANYRKAEEAADDKSAESVNAADYNRLMNAANPKIQQQAVEQKIEKLDKESQRDEVFDAYKQKAEISLKNKDTKEAIESLKKAMPYANAEPAKAAEITNKLADVYAESNEYEKAVVITDSVLKKAERQNDVDVQIGQLQALGGIYFKKGEPEKAVSSLRKAYDLSFRNGKTAEAKKSLAQLLNFYKSKGDAKSSLALYDEFFRNFDRLIHADSTLIDAKTFQVTESKIRQLENEKKLKDELISRKNLFNYVLLGSVILLLLLFAFIVRALYAIRIKNKEIALQSLRREMNPHFIFNSLNSVNQFIAQNDEREANKYLSSYSNLMRNMMENSNRDFITLGNEIDQLQKYLELEHMRFRDKFDYKITIDENLDTETTFIPNMIVQPHLENSVWHGLRYKDSKGLLQLKFGFEDGKVTVTVDDDGIGLTKSKELKTQHQKVHESRGITNTKERMQLLNELYKKEISLSVNEKKAPHSGTIVTIAFPLIDKIS